MTRVTQIKKPFHKYKDRTHCYICGRTLQFPYVYKVGHSCKYFNKYACKNCVEHNVFQDIDDDEPILMFYKLIQPDGSTVTVSEVI